MKKDVTLLVSRIIIGGIFVVAGWAKVSDMGTTVAQFATMGIPAFLAYAVGYLELLGGLSLVLGFYSCKPKAILAIIMIVAVYYTFPMGLQGYMAPLAVLGGVLALMASGDGKYAVKEGPAL